MAIGAQDHEVVGVISASLTAGKNVVYVQLTHVFGYETTPGTFTHLQRKTIHHYLTVGTTRPNSRLLASSVVSLPVGVVRHETAVFCLPVFLSLAYQSVGTTDQTRSGHGYCVSV